MAAGGGISSGLLARTLVHSLKLWAASDTERCLLPAPSHQEAASMVLQRREKPVSKKTDENGRGQGRGPTDHRGWGISS